MRVQSESGANQDYDRVISKAAAATVATNGKANRVAPDASV
jgi:hypothetical protein